MVNPGEIPEVEAAGVLAILEKILAAEMISVEIFLSILSYSQVQKI